MFASPLSDFSLLLRVLFGTGQSSAAEGSCDQRTKHRHHAGTLAAVCVQYRGVDSAAAACPALFTARPRPFPGHLLHTHRQIHRPRWT